MNLLLTKRDSQITFSKLLVHVELNCSVGLTCTFFERENLANQRAAFRLSGTSWG